MKPSKSIHLNTTDLLMVIDIWKLYVERELKEVHWIFKPKKFE